MKTDVENLSETRIKLAVELPFDELAQHVDDAYKRIADQVQIPGFRKGRVPRQIIDQRFGRGAVLEEVVNAAVPSAYDTAIREAGVFALGQPQVEVTDIVDGERIAFVAEVDIRPDFELPEYRGLAVTLDALEVSDQDVDDQLAELAGRFATLSDVERPIAEGDVLQIDVAGSDNGEPVDDLTAQAMSYEVGSGEILPGIDEAVTGASQGDEVAFTFTPGFGEYEGKDLAVTVTIQGVREKVLPALDDAFALIASEFDTLDDLRADLRERLGRVRLVERGQMARERLHEQLLDAIDVPLPEGIIAGEVESHFEDHEESDDEHRAQVEADARKNLKSQFLLDRIAEAEELNVAEAELSQWLMIQAPRYGMSPDQFAQALVDAGQVNMAVAEVRRGKAMAVVLESAVITDSDGNTVSLEELTRLPGAEFSEEEAEDAMLTEEEAVEVAEAIEAELLEEELEEELLEDALEEALEEAVLEEAAAAAVVEEIAEELVEEIIEEIAEAAAERQDGDGAN